MGAMQVTMIDENKYAETMTDVVLPALEQCCEEGWFDPSAAERSAGIEPLSGIMDTGGRSGQLHYLCYDSAKFDAIREQGATAIFRGAIVISHGFTEFAEIRRARLVFSARRLLGVCTRASRPRQVRARRGQPLHGVD